LSDLKIAEKEPSTDINNADKLKVTSSESEIPVIAETFPLETESSMRDSILSQPEIRQILRPQFVPYRERPTTKANQAGGKIRGGRTELNH
jgi:hypothetical protein